MEGGEEEIEEGREGGEKGEEMKKRIGKCLLY